MDADIIASLIAIHGVALVIAGAGVLIVRPLATRIGDLLGAVIEEKRAQTALLYQEQQQKKIMEAHAQRLELLEERLQFAEALLDGDKLKLANADFTNRESAQ